MTPNAILIIATIIGVMVGLLVFYKIARYFYETGCTDNQTFMDYLQEHSIVAFIMSLYFCTMFGFLFGIAAIIAMGDEASPSAKSSAMNTKPIDNTYLIYQATQTRSGR